jgi:uncharacterized pyridoxamine 5'-phosphate oxidase family protein
MGNDKPNGKFTRVEAEIAVDQMIEILPAMLRQVPYQAKVFKAKYDALVKEGFTKEEALDIVKSRPLFE